MSKTCSFSYFGAKVSFTPWEAWWHLPFTLQALFSTGGRDFSRTCRQKFSMSGHLKCKWSRTTNVNTERYGPTKRPAALRRALKKMYCTVYHCAVPRCAAHAATRNVSWESLSFTAPHFLSVALSGIFRRSAALIATFAECAAQRGAAQRSAAPRRASRRSVWWVRSFNHRPILCQLGIVRGAESHHNASYRA